MSRAGEATSCEFKKTAGNKRQWNTNARQRSENKRGQLAFPRHVCVDGSKSGGAPVCHVTLAILLSGATGGPDKTAGGLIYRSPAGFEGFR